MSYEINISEPYVPERSCFDDVSPAPSGIADIINPGSVKRAPFIMTTLWPMVSDVYSLGLKKFSGAQFKAFKGYHPQIGIGCTNVEKATDDLRFFKSVEAKGKRNAEMFYALTSLVEDQVIIPEVRSWLSENRIVRDEAQEIESAKAQYRLLFEKASAFCAEHNPDYQVYMAKLEADRAVLQRNPNDKSARADLRKTRARLAYIVRKACEQDIYSLEARIRKFANRRRDAEERILRSPKNREDLSRIIEIGLGDQRVAGEWLNRPLKWPGEGRQMSLLERLTEAVATTSGGFYRINADRFGTTLPRGTAPYQDLYPTTLLEEGIGCVNTVMTQRASFTVFPFDMEDKSKVDIRHGPVLLGKFWPGGWRVHIIDPRVVYYMRLNAEARVALGDVEWYLASCGSAAVMIDPSESIVTETAQMLSGQNAGGEESALEAYEQKPPVELVGESETADPMVAPQDERPRSEPQQPS